MRIEPGSKVLLDTNVLLEATDQGRAHHEAATEVISRGADWDGIFSSPPRWCGSISSWPPGR